MSANTKSIQRKRSIYVICIVLYTNTYLLCRYVHNYILCVRRRRQKIMLHMWDYVIPYWFFISADTNTKYYVRTILSCHCAIGHSVLRYHPLSLNKHCIVLNSVDSCNSNHQLNTYLLTCTQFVYLFVSN